MNTQILDGKALAAELRQKIKKQIAAEELKPGLAVVLVGEDEPSKLYVNLKRKACEEVDITFSLYHLPATVSQADVLKVIDWLNQDEQIDAVLVQLPLPQQFNEEEIIAAIAETKEVDGFNKKNLARLAVGQELIIPGLVNGIVELIQASHEDLTDKVAAIVARSEEFKQAVGAVLAREKVKTIFAHPADQDLLGVLSEADIIISAVGQPNFIKGEMIKTGAIIIDVGITKQDKKVLGDVAADCWKKAGYISPVPGGVGPLTVAGLLENVYVLASRHAK
jgi:methylenetetrahydrofolate dehydrogenase (NADP+)/methenyltetrahydrofolate cyclohydrolase